MSSAIAGSAIQSIVLARKASPIWRRGRLGQPLVKNTSSSRKIHKVGSINCRQAPEIASEINESARAPQFSGL